MMYSIYVLFWVKGIVVRYLLCCVVYFAKRAAYKRSNGFDINRNTNKAFDTLYIQ